MSSMTFGQKTFQPTPPEKGSFPLDHQGVCRNLMIEYMKCLNRNDNDNSLCRIEARDYLDCRMKNNLMAKEEWSKLVGCTGSVATLKLPILIEKLSKTINNINIRIVVTEHAKHFFNKNDLSKTIELYEDSDEWAVWSDRGDPVLHIELSKWADIFLIAPLDANTLAKIANGLCDNLLTCTLRAWDLNKTIIFCPAMNTKMYQHPITQQHIDTLLSWNYQQIPVIEKKLICGDTGPGAMAEIETIVDYIKDLIIGKQ